MCYSFINYKLTITNMTDYIETTALDVIAPIDDLELKLELQEIAKDEALLLSSHEGTVSEYEYSAKQWQDVINKPALSMI